MQYALGHFLEVISSSTGQSLRFQNFFVDQTVDGRGFLPFGFSGTTTNRQGDNLDATLTFPNNEISRSWAAEALEDGWTAIVDVYMMLDPADPNNRRLLYQYFGQVSSGGWDETALNLRLNTVLDAVRGNVPNRVLHRGIVGKLPTSSAAGI